MARAGTWLERGHGSSGDVARAGTWLERGHGSSGDVARARTWLERGRGSSGDVARGIYIESTTGGAPLLPRCRTMPRMCRARCYAA